MTDKEAIKMLLNIAEKYELSAKEKGAILTAIGMLGWSSLSEGRLKALKKKAYRDLE
jgi:hypothetical protein